MTKKSGDPQAPNRILSSWDEIAECLGGFPAPTTSIDCDSEAGEIVAKKAWVFRGLKSSCYELQPTIEREARSTNWRWSALEVHVSNEFKARARMHLSPPLIPDDELTWLALMQHYAIPTRLLDFTYSPFVALYFAIRVGHEGPARRHVRVWAVDSIAVNNRFDWIARDKKFPLLSIYDIVPSQRDILTTEAQSLRDLIGRSMVATGRFKWELNRSGCICAVSPPASNPRLVNQQGIFLVNCAEDLVFQESLIR